MWELIYRYRWMGSLLGGFFIGTGIIPYVLHRPSGYVYLSLGAITVIVNFLAIDIHYRRIRRRYGK